MQSRIAELFKYRAMLWSLIQTDLRSRYKGSVLGFLWTFLNPLLTLIIYSAVYSYILRVSMPHYSDFLFIGILAWNLFSSSVQSSTRAIINQASMVKKIYFPREILPLSIVGGSLINYLLSTIILIPYLMITGIEPTIFWVYWPLVILVELLITSGIALILSVLTVYLRDLEHMVSIFLMLGFYLTPIFYPLSLFPHRYQIFLKLNPLTSIFVSYQNIIYRGEIMPWKLFVYGFLFAVVMLTLGWIIFGKLNRRLAEEV